MCGTSKGRLNDGLITESEYYTLVALFCYKRALHAASIPFASKWEDMAKTVGVIAMHHDHHDK